MAAIYDVPAGEHRALARSVPEKHRAAMGPAELASRVRHVADLDRSALNTPDQALSRALLARARHFLTAMPHVELQRQLRRLREQAQTADGTGDPDFASQLRAEARRLADEHPQAPASGENATALAAERE